VPASLQQLQRDVDALVAAPDLARTTWGITIKSAANDASLYSLNGAKLLAPASNMKILTLAAAAERLGWDYAFETRLVGSGPIEDDVLRGDLVVVGSGDPSIDDWDGAASRLFADWAETLKMSGIHTITGRIIGDDDSFDDEMFGSGWAWDDLDRSFATGVGALQFNENTAQLRLTPGMRAGEPAAANVVPAGSGLTIRNLVTTSGASAPISLAIRRRLDGPTLEVRGSLPVGSGPILRNVAVTNPTIYFATHLRNALIKAGIDVTGDAVDIDDIADPPSRSRGTILLTHRSEPLSVLATTMMKLSQNLYAETLLRAMGTQRSIGSIDSGHASVVSLFQNWGLSPADFRMVDGSGLSMYDLVTSDLLAAILMHMVQDARLRDAFQLTLPIAGVDGTLTQRMKGTPAAGNARAKSGTLSTSRALSGYVWSADAEPLVFAIIANNFGSAVESVDKAIDAIVVRLAQFTRR
jgi:D-alanyl-D-alanine carboxypeptidase/D-alanyl-D-alanine-endopeptidase (penicillin-binding protein 4)